MRLLVGWVVAASALSPASAIAAGHPATGKAAAKGVAVKAVVDWTRAVAATAQGGYRIGNPDAGVKLIEYGSLTCSHCRAFHADGLAPLKSRYIATGRVSYEYRSYVLNGADFAATLLARCDGAPAFFVRADVLYRAQDEWSAPFAALGSDELAQNAALPATEQIAGLARAAGLDRFMATHGIAAAHARQCLVDQAQQDRIAAIRANAQSIGVIGTPGFLINGSYLPQVITWAQLEPELVRALR